MSNLQLRLRAGEDVIEDGLEVGDAGRAHAAVCVCVCLMCVACVACVACDVARQPAQAARRLLF